MKMLTYILCQLLMFLFTLALYWIGFRCVCLMLVTAQISVLIPAAGLCCLILGLCSTIAGIKHAHRWALGTMQRHQGMPLKDAWRYKRHAMLAFVPGLQDWMRHSRLRHVTPWTWTQPYQDTTEYAQPHQDTFARVTPPIEDEWADFPLGKTFPTRNYTRYDLPCVRIWEEQ